MELNFGGMLIVGLGILILALGINGNYPAVLAALGLSLQQPAAQGEVATLPGVNAPLSEHKALSEPTPTRARAK